MAVFGLLVHFVLIFTYANPFPPKEKTKLDYYSQTYAQPYFHQTWNLFVPPPSANYTLLVKYINQNKIVETVDIFADVLHRHQANRLRGYGPLLIGLVNSIHYVEKNELIEGPTAGFLRRDVNFLVMEQAALQYLRYKTKTEILSTELLLLVSDHPSGRLRAYYTPGYFPQTKRHDF